MDAIAINAGAGIGGLFVETDLEEELKLLRLNVEATMHIAKHAAKHMVAKGSGRILITASIVRDGSAARAGLCRLEGF